MNDASGELIAPFRGAIFINNTSDNYFKVGDVVKYKDIEGKVIVIGVKTTKV